MRLRTQVLAVGLLTLAVPLVGWQSVRQLHLSLQETRADAQTLRAANMRVALAEAGELDAPLALGALPPEPGDWYAERARWPLFVDGYADDWQELVGAPRRYASASRGTSGTTLAVRVARRAARLHLFVTVNDPRVIYHRPPRLDAEAGENERPAPETLLANGDALELFVETPEGRRTHALASVIAPGPVRLVHAARRASASGAGVVLPRWRGEWIDVGGGYQVELELPLPPPGSRVGIAAIDVREAGGSRAAWVGSMSPAAMRGDGEGGGRLRYGSAAARSRLASWVTPGTRARLYDAAGRLLADVDALYAPPPDEEEDPSSGGLAVELVDALLLRLFSWFAAGDLPLFPETEKTRQPLHLDAARRADASEDAPTRRYVTVDNDRVLGTLVRLGDGRREPRGYLLFESNEEHASAYTGSRLARLFALLLLANLAVGALLFAWATRLSLRIRRLSREAGRAVDEDGRIAALSGSDASDEIGDLSRDLSSLLARSAAYTRYLESLSSRLSHELGTPLSVVRTSIENLDRDRLDAESRTLVERAGGGAERLGGIVRALIESTRLEQSVQHATLAPFDAAAWLREARAEYATVYPGHRFRTVGTFAALRAERAVGVADGAGIAPRTGASGRDAPPGATASREVPTPPPPSGPAVPAAAPDTAALPAARPTGSATLLRQALDKLVANAVDFARQPEIALLLTEEAPPPDGRDDVAERVEPRGRRLTVAVADVGAALDAASAARLFEPAYSSRHGRAERGAAPHGGLGLHLVRLIAEAHGGEAFALELGGARADRLVVVGMRLPLGAPPPSSGAGGRRRRDGRV